MLFRELFEEKVYEQSNASALAKSLIGKVSDPDAIKKATDYLVGLANQIIKVKDKQVDQQPWIDGPEKWALIVVLIFVGFLC